MSNSEYRTTQELPDLEWCKVNGKGECTCPYCSQRIDPININQRIGMSNSLAHHQSCMTIGTCKNPNCPGPIDKKISELWGGNKCCCKKTEYPPLIQEPNKEYEITIGPIGF
jgi:hypothetical protein